ncbi:rhodanese-like domain-containing protein [Spiroplasma endosymbiont of Crioceris asparagi]|uniref:rhodanese-like domain-containing protein n=1 Tax=Spiroplasma endosymbiont of Crioceris asparagi TaxID=3066286 RepID=UPI0030D39DDD
MNLISNKDFDKIKDKAIVVDVRSEFEYSSLEKIEPSINCPIMKFLKNYEDIVGTDKSRYIVTICNGGNRSGEAAIFLRQQGYKNAYVLERGIYGYKHLI